MKYQEPLSLSRWEDICLSLFTQEIAPDQINWFEYVSPENSLQHQLNLFAIAANKNKQHPLNEKFKRSLKSFPFYKDYQELAGWVLCHRSESKFKYLYSLFCKACKDPSVMASTTDRDMEALKELKKQVQKDIYKMQDCIQFRTHQEEKRRVLYAWYEPLHFILQKNASFFMNKYMGKEWMIVTPQGVLSCIHGQLVYKEESAVEGLVRRESNRKQHFSGLAETARVTTA